MYDQELERALVTLMCLLETEKNSYRVRDSGEHCFGKAALGREPELDAIPWFKFNHGWA